MDPYLLLLVGTGTLVLLVAWLPMAVKELPLSLPMFCVAFGAAVFGVSAGDTPSPLAWPATTERLTELVVIVALTGAGLKLDRPFGWRSWSLTWRLLGFAMPLSIAGIALVGHWLLGLGAAAALLLGAALAPTDPVLASDIQVGPPGSGEEDEVRFTLTAEAGLNDGLAFPFVMLAIGLAENDALWGDWVWEWAALDVLWRLGSGIAAGFVIGSALGWLTFRMPNRARLSRTGDGFVALGVTFLTYGLTQLIEGYGFVAVFVAAVAMRAAERNHDYHDRLHDFAEQTERLLMMVLLVLFGGALASGLLAPLTWAGVAAVLLILFVVRPAAGMLSLSGSHAPWEERAAIGFFGIRGLGSLYYLAFALNQAAFGVAAELWAVIGLTVLVSIALHGVTVTPAMRLLDERRRRQGVLPLGG